jgi:transketolase
VLPRQVRARLSIEAGVSLGWERWVGDEGAILAIDGFGLSAPAEQIFEHFGFTAENVTRVARGVLAGEVRGIVSEAGGHLGSTTLDALEAR